MIRRILEAIDEVELRPTEPFKKVNWDWDALKAEYDKWIQKAKEIYAAEPNEEQKIYLKGTWDLAKKPFFDKTDPRPMMKWFGENVNPAAFTTSDYKKKPKGPNPNAGKWIAKASDTNGDYIEQAPGFFDTEEEAEAAGRELAQEYAAINAEHGLPGEPAPTTPEEFERIHRGIMAGMTVYTSQVSPEDEW